MKKISSSLAGFYSVLIIAVLIFSYFELTSRTSVKSDEDTLSGIIEKVRTHGINEKISELRNLEKNYFCCRTELMLLAKVLKAGIDSSGNKISENKKKEIINIIGLSGSASSGLTSILTSELKQAEDKEMIKIILLALSRIKSAPESIKDTLYQLTIRFKDGEIETYAHSVMDSQGLELREKEIETIKTLKNSTEEKLNNLLNEKNSVNDEEIKNILYNFSILSKNSESQIPKLKVLLNSVFLDNDQKEVVLRTLRDITSGDDEDTINFISQMMQYDQSYKLRKEALLTLIGINSEQSLKLAKSYGHKYLDGESRPEPVKPHPFRKWILKHKQESKLSKIIGNSN